jgi:hypothetical protein
MPSDEFFSETDCARLAELMERWRKARDGGGCLPSEEQAELDELVAAELVAATNRARAQVKARSASDGRTADPPVARAPGFNQSGGRAG